MRRGRMTFICVTLEVAQVDSDDYFNHIVHKDLDRIVKDIQTAHTSDTTTADERQPTVAEIQRKFAQLIQTGTSGEEALYSGILRPDGKSLMIR